MLRSELLKQFFDGGPRFRLQQAEKALFQRAWHDWSDVTNLAPVVREKLGKAVLWMTVESVVILKSQRGDTWKAVVKGVDGARFETVLMRNRRGHWSVCVSSQVGCAMNCSFCATGKMGFKRNLTVDEIVDQYRFWNRFLWERSEILESSNITNIVFMGMGEPLANYDNVRIAIQELLQYTDLGPTRIVVSTVGLVPMLDRLLKDPEWPPVRLAVSLHSADSETRKKIMPTSYDNFLDKLAEWTGKYFEKFDSKRRHLTFEYILLDGVNDSNVDAEKLARFANRVGKVRINLIPYNSIQTTTGFPENSSSDDSTFVRDRAQMLSHPDGKDILARDEYVRSVDEKVEHFQELLEKKGVTVTCRRAMGEDIAAACGQLVTQGAGIKE